MYYSSLCMCIIFMNDYYCLELKIDDRVLKIDNMHMSKIVTHAGSDRPIFLSHC